MDLYIVRHAWTPNRDAQQWPDDDLRPLTDEGKKRFAKMVKRLADGDFNPEVIGTSPLVRCRQTADIVAAKCSEKPEIVELDELRPGSTLEGLLRWTAQQARKHTRLAWVGHAPDVDLLAAALVGSGDTKIHFAKGAVAAIRFDDQLIPAAGELQWLATAKLLGC
jgi:phosphohistidine phosphatase